MYETVRDRKVRLKIVKQIIRKHAKALTWKPVIIEIVRTFECCERTAWYYIDDCEGQKSPTKL